MNPITKFLDPLKERLPLYQVAARELWLGEDVETAVSALRLHHQLLPDYVQYEEGFDQVSVVVSVHFCSSASLPVPRAWSWRIAEIQYKRDSSLKCFIRL